MTAKSIAISRGNDGFKITDFTIGTSAPGTADIELRFNLTDFNGATLRKLDVLKALNAFETAIISGAIFTTLPGI